MRHSYYHRTLRTTAVITALVLAFDSGVFSEDTRTLSDSASQYLANAVGVMAVVPQNEINTLSEQIKERTIELDRREREIDARSREDENKNNSTYILSAILILLLFLIVTNYILDIYREQKRIVTA